MCTGSLLELYGAAAARPFHLLALHCLAASHGLVLAACKLAYLHLPARYNTHKYTYTGGLLCKQSVRHIHKLLPNRNPHVCNAS